MAEGFRFLEDIATADTAFAVDGVTLSGLFQQAALALESVIVDLTGVGRIEKRELRVENQSLEGLLFDFLSELVYLQSAKNLVFGDFEVQIIEGANYSLTAVCRGELLDPERHQLGTEVKAVTWHQFKVEKTAEGWQAQVILDI